jgi:hypothetical protein
MLMMVKVNESWPVSVTDKVRKKDLELIKNNSPGYIKRVGIKIIPSYSVIKAFTLFEVKKGREIKGIQEIENLFTAFSTIHGFTYYLECELCSGNKTPV